MINILTEIQHYIHEYFTFSFIFFCIEMNEKQNSANYTLDMVYLLMYHLLFTYIRLFTVTIVLLQH